jgi:hypothetical protein
VANFQAAPFTVRVSEEVLADLRARIRNTRWPGPAPGAPWSQGTDLGYLQDLMAYWADAFDWRAQERWLNSFSHFQAELDGIRVHFVHERARSGDGIPLVVTNSWPSCFAEYLPVVHFLTDLPRMASMGRDLTWSSRRCLVTGSPIGRPGPG